jgi:dTDP-4-dehydrorhamnose reductase
MRRVLVTGASGQLGSYLLRELHRADSDVTAWNGTRGVDLGDEAALTAAFRAARPDVVLHAAAMARIADCHRDPPRARRVNTDGTATLARLAAESAARLVFVSTDLVFDGEKPPYREGDAVSPLSVYGRTKADSEAAVLAAPRAVVARVSLLFGPSLNGRPSFFDEQVTALRTGKPLTLFADEWRTPLDLATAARALLAVARSDCTGLLHLGGPERLSRLEMGRRLAAHLGADAAAIRPARRDEVPAPESRPRDTSLDSSRWRALFPGFVRPFEEALREMLRGDFG